MRDELSAPAKSNVIKMRRRGAKLAGLKRIAHGCAARNIESLNEIDHSVATIETMTAGEFRGAFLLLCGIAPTASATIADGMALPRQTVEQWCSGQAAPPPSLRKPLVQIARSVVERRSAAYFANIEG